MTIGESFIFSSHYLTLGDVSAHVYFYIFLYFIVIGLVFDFRGD